MATTRTPRTASGSRGATITSKGFALSNSQVVGNHADGVEFDAVDATNIAFKKVTLPETHSMASRSSTPIQVTRSTVSQSIL
jgi:hypothetical protein